MNVLSAKLLMEDLNDSRFQFLHKFQLISGTTKYSNRQKCLKRVANLQLQVQNLILKNVFWQLFVVISKLPLISNKNFLVNEFVFLTNFMLYLLQFFKFSTLPFSSNISSFLWDYHLWLAYNILFPIKQYHKLQHVLIKQLKTCSQVWDNFWQLKAL